MKILTIGDCHIREGDNLGRFSLLSKLIIKEKPEYIVIMGDFVTLQCLSAWDKNKRQKLENLRYKTEIALGNKALDLLMSEIVRYNKHKAKTKHKGYKPTIVYLEGNHEDRLTRYLEQDPTFDGFVGIEKDLRLKERGIIFSPYREYYYINGIAFTHVPFNESQAISGADVTKKASFTITDSVVFAHTHRLEMSNWHKQGQKHLQQILTVGCFFEAKEDYVKGCVTRYWKGVVMLDSWKEGRFEIETHSLSKMRRIK